MATDLSNREEQIYDYLKEVMKEEFPEADLRDDGEFMETFGLPHIKLFAPVLNFIDRIRLMQSLENAGNMTEEEMNEIAHSNYTSRKLGNTSNGIITLVFEDVPSSGVMVIPIGIEATSKTGLVYRSIETVTLDEVTLIDHYDPSSFSYRIPVLFTASMPGSEYDVKPGEITELTKGTLPNLVEVINEEGFVGGTDSETNTELAQRIESEMFAPNLGIERGYKRYINSFEETRESLIAGYGHPLMKRDVIGRVEVPGIKFDENIRDLHWGTKVDIYVRGESPLEKVDYVKADEDEAGNIFIPLKSVPVLDIIDLKLYSPEGDYDDPDIEQATLYISNYTLSKEEDFETEGTIYEKSRAIISDDRVEKDTYVQVTYRYNELIGNIHEDMYEDDGRPPTADVKIKEANKRYVFGSLIVGMDDSIGLRDSDRSLIRQRLSTWIDSLSLGEELQFSDLLEPLTIDDPVYSDGIVDYIHLPFQFIVTENDSRFIYYCMSERRRKAFESIQSNSEFLNRIFNRYKDSVTTFDFFDILHSLTHGNGFKESMEDIRFMEGNWNFIVEAFERIRKMTLHSHATRKLSPAKKEIQENEYFQFGETYIYEAKRYDKNDWEQMLYLFWNVAKQNEENDDVKEMYYLAVYVLTVMYMITTDDYIGDPDKLYDFARGISVSTPVEFEFDI